MRLEERFLPSRNDTSTGPASVVRAEVELDGARQTVTDYWRLVYAADRHNRHVRRWVVLDPPLDVAGIGSPIHAVEIAAPEPTAGSPAEAQYLGASFEVLASPRVLFYDARRREEPAEAVFRRGDVNADGTVSAADALGLLDVLFRRGQPSTCLKAADADDDGTLDLSDPVRILLYVFGRERRLPAPLGPCSVDPTPDGLSCVSYPACGQ